MRRMPFLLLVGVAIFAVGCGSSRSPSPPSHASTQQRTVQTQDNTKNQSRASSTGSGTTQRAPATAAAGSVSSGGPIIRFSMMPAGAAPAPAASLGVSGLPNGWQLTRMALVGPNGLIVSNTVQEAMTETFSQARGGFSMGADGQIITFFFPSPAGSWAGQPVRFVFTFRTASGQVETARTDTFTFPT